MSANGAATQSPMRRPSEFAAIDDIFNGKHPERSLVHVVSSVVDMQAPIPTRGTDWKCAFRLSDLSLDGFTVLLSIFKKESEMPKVSWGDVVIVFSAKVQKREGTFSLLNGRNTDIYVFEAGKIPRPPKPASSALKPSPVKLLRSPTAEHLLYVSQLYHSRNEGLIPDQPVYNARAVQSLNVKNKFSELKDVTDGRFYDTYAQVVRDPYDGGEKMTLWVSDFTVNDSFFNFQIGGLHKAATDRDEGDPYGYLARFGNSNDESKEWKGPYGKRSMQITCFDPHAAAVRSEGLKAGAWVSIRNLHVRTGHNGANLEGILHQDRGRPDRVLIEKLDLSDGCADDRLKEAIRRKRDYDNTRRRQEKLLKQNGTAAAAAAAATAGGGTKRSFDADDSSNLATEGKAKAARSTRRALKRKHYQEAAADVLNKQIKCEHPNKPTSTIESMLKPITYRTSIDGQQVPMPLPFINSNYRSDVRVVDFRPRDLARFSRLEEVADDACVLSDDDRSDLSSDDDGDVDANGIPYSQLPEDVVRWRWRFWLQLEDASPLIAKAAATTTTTTTTERPRMWVVVSNEAAECLFNMDACDLHSKPRAVEDLRNRLFLLWGDLEERKAKEMAIGAITRRLVDGPPLSSPANSISNSNNNNKSVAARDASSPSPINNRPFTCCIRQYGVRAHEPDAARADAGDGKRWQRIFGLFGTKICGV